MPPPGYRKSVTRYKVEQILTPAQLVEYQERVRDPRSTVKSLHAWLAGRGLKIGYAAVGRHRRRFDQDVQAVRKTAMLAEHFADASKSGGLAALSDATVARFQQVLLERLLKLDKADQPGARSSADFSTREWLELAKTIGQTVSTRRTLEGLRAEYDQRHREAVAAAEAAAQTGDGKSVVDRVREILGV